MRSTRNRKLVVLTLIGTTLALTGFSCEWLFGRRPVRRLEMVQQAPVQMESTMGSLPAVVRDFVNT